MSNVSFEHDTSLEIYFCKTSNFNLHSIVLKSPWKKKKHSIRAVTGCCSPSLFVEKSRPKGAWVSSANCRHITHHPFQEKRCQVLGISLYQKDPKAVNKSTEQNRTLCFALWEVSSLHSVSVQVQDVTLIITLKSWYAQHICSAFILRTWPQHMSLALVHVTSKYLVLRVVSSAKSKAQLGQV